MRNKMIYSTLCCAAFGLISSAQTNPLETKDGNINLLDAQANILGNVFGDSLTGGKGKITNYLDLVKHSDLSAEDKKKLTEAYLSYSKSIDPKSKDSLETAMAERFMQSQKKDSIR